MNEYPVEETDKLVEKAMRFYTSFIDADKHDFRAVFTALAERDEAALDFFVDQIEEQTNDANNG